MPEDRSLSRDHPERTTYESLFNENALLRQQINDLEETVSQLEQAGARPADKPIQETAVSPAAAPSETIVSHALLESGCVRFGHFTLKSGLVSPVYLDLRRLSSFPEALRTIAAAYLPILKQLTFAHLAAVPYTALPIGTALSLTAGFSMLCPRREVKDHGTQASVEGVFQPGETAVVIDDIATTGLSTTEAIERLQAVGLRVLDVVVLVDREQGATEALARRSYQLHAVTTLRNLLIHWHAAGAVSAEQLADLDLSAA